MWYPPELCQLSRQPPFEGVIRANLPDGTRLEAEVFFLALNMQHNLKKLLSLEVTGAYFNELREIPKELVDAAIGRCGQYPNKVVGATCTWWGAWADTNMCDTDHWIYRYAEEGAWRAKGTDNVDDLIERLEVWAETLKQDPDGQGQLMGVDFDEETIELLRERLTDGTSKKLYGEWEFFRQPGALIRLPDGNYYPNPKAENVDNLREKYRYYFRLLQHNSEEWIKVHILAEYGSTYEGRPVFADLFNSALHVSKTPLEPIRELPMIIGWDPSGSNPAAVFAQITPRGQLRVYREYICLRGWLRELVEEAVKPAMMTEFQGFRWQSWTYREVISSIDGTTAANELARMGIPTGEVKTDRLEPRIQAVASFLTKHLGNEPGFLLDGLHCPILRRGFNGGYRKQKSRILGDESTYQEKPVKDKYSHPQDALQAIALAVDVAWGRPERIHIDLPSGPIVSRAVV